jgi:hypothetical protein
MTTPLVAISSPPRAPTAGDHVQGFVAAIVGTVVGAILTPFIALAWVAFQPVLAVVVALRARELDRTDAVAAATADRAAA